MSEMILSQDEMPLDSLDADAEIELVLGAACLALLIWPLEVVTFF